MTKHYWKLGILGYPLGYSLSPLMHQRALAHAKLRGEYKEYPVAADDLWDWLSRVGEMGLDGFNVTMPYKKSVFAWVVGEGRGRLGRVEAHDAQIGAINTVVLEDGHPIGYNTDGIGFLRSLAEPPHKIDLGGRSVLLLGAGGAAQAIAATLAMATKTGRMTIWSRTPSHAESLARLVNGIRSEKPLAQAAGDLSLVQVERYDLVVNATPVGMKSHPGTLLDASRLRAGQLVYDLVYEPRETELIRSARERGCVTVTGDCMLAGQGAAAFELWTGVKGMLPIMREALDEFFSAR